MKFSIHQYVRGKPDRITLADGKTVWQQNNETVNLGYDWISVECSPEEAFELITTDGCATSCDLKDDHRHDESFVSRQMFMVDIDNGMTIPELFQDQFYNECGYAFYATPSHRDDLHRFRIVFITETPITDLQKARNLFSGLLKMYQHSDTACKDASRIFYGTIDCQLKEINNKYLTDPVVEELCRLGQQENERKVKIVNNYQHDKKYRSDIVSELLQRIAASRGSLRGQYNDWLQIAWATCHTIGVNEAVNLMKQYFPEKTKLELHAFNSWNPDESPTIGTLIYLSKITREEFNLLEIKYGYRERKQVLTPEEAIFRLRNNKMR